MLEKLLELEKHYEDLNAQLSAPETGQNPALFQKLAREVGDMREVVEVAAIYRQAKARCDEADEIIAAGEDGELVELAAAERDDLSAQIEELEAQLKVLLIPKDPNDARDAIIEIRAGAGGDEAGLFASDIHRMYQRFAERNSLKIEMLSSSLNPSGGFKEVVFSVTGKEAFGRLKYESGVHRVQRVPKTETAGR
ncbi:MAG: PCRF domain-containing protein, partial [Candidatus Latescibacterota bacterium]|nr:PCRF domain-containing protein [Candidatus Latescibacterota bacterium]